MTFDIVPGNALGCRTNAHRHGWDGSICEDAVEWACGIEADFRQKYCAAGVPRCFHLHLFDEDSPHLVIPDSGVGWLLGRHPTAFDDQILLIWAPQAEEPHGMVGGRPVGSFMAGAYRIESVERIEQRNHVEWKIHPYDDGWTYMGSLDTQAPRFIHLGGPYIKQVDRSAITPLFTAALEAGQEVSEYWTQPEKERLEHFSANVDAWLTLAEQRIRALLSQESAVARRARDDSREGPVQRSMARGDAGSDEPELMTRLIPSPPKSPSTEPPDHYPLIAAGKRQRVAEVYGERTLNALRVASLTHPVILLRGHSGVGKSTLALDLIDDPQRQRMLVVPVRADWKGPEDLFGRLSEDTGAFEPTLFTNFMRAAELAWRSGDFATRIVVFENFDASPPEIWLSEILIRAQYPARSTSERSIDLGAELVRGWAPGATARLMLSPAVRFVATVDEPLRPGTLSSRLLDDIAVVELSVSTQDALKLAGASVTPKQLEGLVELDRCTRSLFAGIAFTTARSIATCNGRLEELGIDAWAAIDLVLCLEVASKLELIDPKAISEDLGHRLVAWGEGPGKKFLRCAERLAAWGESVSRAGLFEE
jgi:hypothetical protein